MLIFCLSVREPLKSFEAIFFLDNLGTIEYFEAD